LGSSFAHQCREVHGNLIASAVSRRKAGKALSKITLVESLNVTMLMCEFVHLYADMYLFAADVVDTDGKNKKLNKGNKLPLV
jgi:hypothetical protein